MSCSEWKKVRLAEVLEPKGYIRGPFGSALRRNELQESGIPVYEQQNAIYNHRNFRFYVNNIKYDELKRFTVKENDMMISCSGTIGRVSMIQRDDPVGIISQALLLLRCDNKKINPKFFYYFLTSTEGQNAIASVSSGSVQVNIAKRNIVENINILLPPISEQKEIAATLSCLDDKIELNNRINKNLEEMAQAIFKRWFVDFEFPDENGNPYKSSGGEMVESEMGEIPKGWKVVQLGEIIQEIKDKVKDLQLPVLSAVKSGKLVLSEEYFTKQVFSKDISNYIMVKPFEFAYNPARINIGSIGMNELNYPGCVSPVYVAFKCNPKYKWFFKIYIRSERFVNEVKIRASGSVRQTLSINDFSIINQIYPSEEIVEKFNEVFEKFYLTQLQRDYETSTLLNIKNLILPKLMSGEICVPCEEAV